MPSPKPFKEQVEALAKEQDLSISKLGWKAHDPQRKGTSQDTLNKALQGRRPLNDPIVEAVAGALGVPPETFIEYRISKLTQALDWRAASFERAAGALLAIEAALSAQGDPDLEAAIDAALLRAEGSSPNSDASSRSPRRQGKAG